MRNLISKFILLNITCLLIISLTGCGGGGGSADPVHVSPFVGTWQGTATRTSGGVVDTFAITVTADGSYTGTVHNTYYYTYPVNGVIQDDGTGTYYENGVSYTPGISVSLKSATNLIGYAAGNGYRLDLSLQ